MNTDHAVDVYYDTSKDEFLLLRRRDESLLAIPGNSEARVLGHAVISGIDRSFLQDFEWHPFRPKQCIDWENSAAAVAFRDNQALFVSTPIYAGNIDEHPKIELAFLPAHLELGKSVLDRLRYSKEMNARNS